MSEHRFYGELASWWPMISPVDDYAEESKFIATQLRRGSIPVRDVLELGSGGGHVAFHLKNQFEVTLVDLSDDMLDMSRRINPECAHGQGDMRTVRVAREFDAVLIHDAVDYMTSEADLAAAMATAHAHLRPGGVAVFVPDETRESYAESTGMDGRDVGDDWGVRYMEWTWDPDPTDDTVLTEYVFLLRSPDGIRSVHETHETGIFSIPTWTRLLGEAGFVPEAVRELTTEERSPRVMFVGVKPTT